VAQSPWSPSFNNGSQLHVDGKWTRILYIPKTTVMIAQEIHTRLAEVALNTLAGSDSPTLNLERFWFAIVNYKVTNLFFYHISLAILKIKIKNGSITLFC
jgi:hypothetical protein